VRLTAQGRRRLESALPAMRHVDKALLAAVPAANRAMFKAVLVSLAETADQMQAESEGPSPAKKAPPAVRKPAARKKARSKR
jgi:hypothetical protein